MSSPIEEIPNMIPRLIRNLSEHHWMAAEMNMAQKRITHDWVGSAPAVFSDYHWEYEIDRKNTTTRDAVRQTYKNGELVEETHTKLPIPLQCKGYNKDGKRCSKKVYTYYCNMHAE